MTKHILFAPITWCMIFINTVSYQVIQYYLNTQGEDAVDVLLAFTGVTPIYLCQQISGFGYLIYYTFVSSMFVHLEFEHIFFNMLLLFAYGTAVEPSLGKLKFILLYVIGGVLSECVYILTADNCTSISVIGASGAISAVIGAYIVGYFRSKITSLVWHQYSLWCIACLWILFQLYKISINANDVAYWEHVGGVIIGATLMFFMRPKDEKK